MKPRSARLIPSTGKLLAAVPAIVCASHAKAQIVYTDLSPGLVDTNIYFALDGSVIANTTPTNYDFQLSAKSGLSVTENSQRSGPLIVTDGSNHATIFSAGDLIHLDTKSAANGNASVAPSDVPFYIGLAVPDSNHFDVGWAEVEYSGGSTVTLDGFAYDPSGADIHAGQTAIVPEPGSATALAGLVAGSVAAFAARRKRKAAALAA